MSACNCRNHLGRPKQQHATKTKALVWIVRTGMRHGMTLEPYPCPTSKKWHVRTRRTR